MSGGAPSGKRTVVFELNDEGVRVPSEGVAIVQGLDADGELAMDISTLGDIDPVTALGMVEAAAIAYRKRVESQFE